MTFTYDRPLTDDERDLMAHIRMWGSTGYPVRKLGRRWTWGYRESISAPHVYTTKREAVASFDTFMSVLRSCYAAEMYRRNVAEMVAR